MSPDMHDTTHFIDSLDYTTSYWILHDVYFLPNLVLFGWLSFVSLSAVRGQTSDLHFSIFNFESWSFVNLLT